MIEINKSKLMPKILLGLAVLITIMGLTTSARAGVPPFMWVYYSEYNSITSLKSNTVIEAPHDEPCIWGVMAGCSEDEIGYFPLPPYKQILWIDGEKIPLLRFTWNDTYGIFGIPGTKLFAYYHVFKAGYFDVGEYEIHHEMWVQKPYFGDEVYGWRIYADFTYTLKIT